MNIRFETGSIRFKISCEELTLLLSGRNIHESINLISHSLSFCISAAAETTVMILEANAQTISLTVPAHILKELEAKGRQRDGVSQNLSDTEISLQVDVKSYSRSMRGNHAQ